MIHTNKYAKRDNIPGMQKDMNIVARIIQAKWIYLALVPSFFLLGLFSMYPAINAIEKSFFFWKESSIVVKFIGLRNYVQLLHDGQFWHSFVNLGIFIVWGFILTFAILMPVTYLVYKLGENSCGKWFQRFYVIPMMIPGMVLTLFWRFFYDYNYGILNSLLKSIGLGNFVHVWLGEKATALPSLLFQGFPWVGGFAFLILLSGFQGIDTSLHEAAEIDGARALQKFFSIDIPLIVPQAKLLIILGMIGGIQMYSQQLIMTQGGPDGATMVPGLQMYNEAFVIGDLGYGSTMGVAMFIVILIITLINNKFIQGRE